MIRTGRIYRYVASTLSGSRVTLLSGPLPVRKACIERTIGSGRVFPPNYSQVTVPSNTITGRV